MWPNSQFPTDLVKFTEDVLNGKLHFLCCAKFTLNKNICSVNLGIQSQGKYGLEKSLTLFTYLMTSARFK